MELDRNSLVLGLGIGGVVGAIGGLYFLRSSNYNQVSPIKDHLNERRSLKLYHSFPFRSSRCAWLINELGIQDIVEVIPVSLHGPGAQDLPKYKSEVKTKLRMDMYELLIIILLTIIHIHPHNV